MRALGALHVVLHAGEVARGPVYHLLDLGRGERLVNKQGRVRHDHVVGEREPRLQREVAPERVLPETNGGTGSALESSRPGSPDGVSPVSRRLPSFFAETFPLSPVSAPNDVSGPDLDLPFKEGSGSVFL